MTIRPTFKGNNFMIPFYSDERVCILKVLHKTSLVAKKISPIAREERKIDHKQQSMRVKGVVLSR